MTYKIALRLAALEKEHRDSIPKKVPKEINKFVPAPIPPTQDIIKEIEKKAREQGHKLRNEGCHVVCVNCRIRRKPGNTLTWTDSECGGNVKRQRII